MCTSLFRNVIATIFFGAWLQLNGFMARAQEPANAIEPLTIALPLAPQTEDGAGCHQAAELLDTFARSYVLHLEERFNTSVTLCLTNSIAESVALTAKMDINLIWVDRENVEELTKDWRSSLTLRPKTGLGRTPYVLFALKSEHPTKLEEISLENVGFLDKKPEELHVHTARSVLEDYGIQAEEVGIRPVTATSTDALFQSVQQGEVQAAILEASTWGMACAILDADSTTCDHFDVLMYDRPRATETFMIPEDTSFERHYRLIGLHIALHLEKPEIFNWLSQGHGSEFEPTEASALFQKSSDNSIAF